MPTRTYRNDTTTTRTVSWSTPYAKSHQVPPAGRFTFNPDDPNGTEIDDACRAAGLTLET